MAGRRQAQILWITRLAPAAVFALIGLLGVGAGVLPAVATAADLHPRTSSGRAAQPLVDRGPLKRGFTDRVLTGDGSGGTGERHSGVRAATGAVHAYRIADGYTVGVDAASGYTLDDAVARTYVDFLAGLPHGSELGRLKITLVPPTTMDTACGGAVGDDILACYDSSTETMLVPGEEISAATGGVTTSYVIAHEYGHHVARNRSNPPFSSMDFGPKRWASRELVCLRTDEGLLAPGDEGAGYLRNPGENWAETYARLTYPEQPWTFSSLLRPDAAALAAARADVDTPWTARVHKTFRGSFSRTGTVNRRTAKITLTLDGAFSVRLSGPANAQYDLAIDTDAGTHEKTAARGARDALSYQAACRGRQSEHVTITVVRRSGSGPYSLSVRYAG